MNFVVILTPSSTMINSPPASSAGSETNVPALMKKNGVKSAKAMVRMR